MTLKNVSKLDFSILSKNIWITESVENELKEFLRLQLRTDFNIFFHIAPMKLFYLRI